MREVSRSFLLSGISLGKLDTFIVFIKDTLILWLSSTFGSFKVLSVLGRAGVKALLVRMLTLLLSAGLLCKLSFSAGLLCKLSFSAGLLCKLSFSAGLLRRLSLSLQVFVLLFNSSFFDIVLLSVGIIVSFLGLLLLHFFGFTFATFFGFTFATFTFATF